MTITAAILALALGSMDDKTVTDALARTNTVRKALGLKPMSLQPSLTKAAKDHAEYMARYGVFTHTQQASKAGFTGADPTARAERAGYKGGYVLEDIATGPLSMSFNMLVGGPYHRQPFVEPSVVDVGIGASGKYTVFVFPVPSGEVSTYPLNGQKGVPTSWNGHDSPSPYRMHTGAKPPFGPPVQIFLRDTSGMTGIDFNLRDAQGKSVACLRNTPANDDFLQDSMMLIPAKPLVPGQTYTASFSAVESSGIKLTKAWSFVTAEAPPR